MKKTAAVLTVSVLSLALAVSASAQTRPSTESSSKESTSKTMRQAWMPQAGALDSTKIVGTRVKNEQNKDVGEIERLIVDQADGKITHVVLGRGGVMGVGEQKVVLAWSDLKMQTDPSGRNRMVAMVDQSKVDGAPRYETRRDRDTSPAASPGTTSSQPRDNKK